ncbi:MAG: class I SAM-dependent rRNA methyltransferase, partial [Blastocatellia bacterium]
GRALDCFTFQGAFALHLAKNAERVIAVDVSAPALKQARRNAEVNRIENVEFVEANVFDFLAELDRSGARFDTIVLDPPAFAKSSDSVEAAHRGYKEINLRAMKMLAQGGTLITSTCSYHVSEESFLNILAGAASDSGRSLALIEKRTQGRDHPILLSMPETHYLKCMILRAQ